MMSFIDKLVEHIERFKNEIDLELVKKVIELINSAENIFLIGSGRSGLVAKAFAMRLMHLGYKAYVVGETITPRIKEKDLLIAISGSGETSYVITYAKKVKELGIKVLAFTSRRDSTLSKIADEVFLIKAEKREEDSKIFPLGTLFEITAMIFLDSLISELIMMKGLSEKDLKERHALE